jgi:hypothetical protein
MSRARKTAVKPQLPAIRSRRKAAVRDQGAKSGVPAQQPADRSYGSFDAWIRLGNRVADYYHSLIEAIGALEAEDAKPPPDINAKSWLWADMPEARRKRRGALVTAAEALLVQWPANEVADAVATFAEGHAHYERDGLYEPPDCQVVSRKFVASRIAMLLGGYPAGTPSDPDIYTRRLVEELIAVEPTATQVEAATRVWIRTSKFLPAPCELLGALHAARTPEYADAFELDEMGEPLVAWARRALEKAVAAAKGQPPRLLQP